MPVELMLDLADSTLIADIHEGFNGIIDFDDQIYLSAPRSSALTRSSRRC